ncbi:MAG: glycosyltransferase family 4 protein, partial [Hyphomicrobiaceae bacterium]
MPLESLEVMMIVFVQAAICFLSSLILGRLLASSRLTRVALDMPNERSLHAAPVPRIGGVVIVLVWIVASAWSGFLPLLVLAGVLSTVSLLDDLRHLSAALRLVVHLACAVAFLAFYGGDLAHMHLPIVALSMVWMTNLYNFMDGSDGLAGGMAVIGFGVYAAGATMAGVPGIAHLSAMLAAAAGGFLVWNTSPARIFLGDVGAIPLGFLAAALGLIGAQGGAWPYWFPVLVFSPFIADSTVTLLRRIGRRERFWEPHREHYYQRLVRMGWSQLKVA